MKRFNKTMRKEAHIISALVISAALLSSCTGTDKPGSEPIGQNNGKKYFTVSDPGVWEQKAAEHDIEITISRVNDKKILEVHVPFAKNREINHYIEAIAVIDKDEKEIQVKRFKRGFGDEGAKFEFPEDFNEPVSVLVKCSLHDMWVKPVDW
jgi:desulfoferrodoxin (superoxide reductase-like protein)